MLQLLLLVLQVQDYPQSCICDMRQHKDQPNDGNDEKDEVAGAVVAVEEEEVIDDMDAYEDDHEGGFVDDDGYDGDEGEYDEDDEDDDKLLLVQPLEALGWLEFPESH